MPRSKKRQDLAEQPQQTLSAAMGYLSRREYTAAELRRKLSERGAEADLIEETLTQLQAKNYQSDERAGRAWINDRARFAPRGRLLLRQELTQQGLDSALIEQLLAEHFPEELERQLLRRFLQAQRVAPAEDPEEREKRWLKLARRAANKGFVHGEIIAALELWKQGALAENDGESANWQV